MDTSSNNSFAPPKSVVADVVSTEDLIKASRAARLGAAFLDGLIFLIPSVPLYIVAFPAMMASIRGTAVGQPQLGLAAYGALFNAMINTGFWFYAALAVTLCLIIYTAILVYRNGQTIGKKLSGIKVVRKDGSRASLSRIFWLRYVLNSVFTFIPVVGKLYALVDLLFIFGEAKRCCHDYLADTIFIRA